VEPSRARRAAGALLAVLAVALLLPVIALASRPERAGGGGPLLAADPARVALDAATYLFAVLVLLGLLLVVWVLWPRPNEELPPLPPRRRWALSSVLAMLAATAILVWLRSSGRVNGLPGLAGLGNGNGRPLPNGVQPPLRAAPPAGVDWIAAGIVAALLVAAGVAVWWLLRPRRRPTGTVRARVQAVLDDAIEDVLGEGDPRRAVIAAWARLERVLGRSGLPRRDSEAPFEYAARAGHEFEMEARWLERLADLFEWARFSTHEVTPAMRDEALDGLVAVRDGLRLAT
jgi:Domain of unknown function (DUF4129)